MEPDDFRRIATAMEGALEGAHMGHPDFRVNKRIFATLHTGDRFGMVKLTPDQQRQFMGDHPGTFTPENGAWGRAGCTRVRLEAAHSEVVGEAVTLAWQNAVNQPNAKSKSTRAGTPARRSRKP